MSPLSIRLIFLSAALAFSMGVSAAAATSELESTFLSQTRQLLFEGRRSGEGYFSPDGTRLIFQSEREPNNPFYQIYLLNLESGDTHRVSPGVGKTTCAFFRPGTDQVLFASTHSDPEAIKKQQEELEFRGSGKTRRYSWDYDPQMDIYLADQKGGGLRRLTDSYGYDAEGAVSPDGQWVVFCSLRDAYPEAGLSAEDRQRLAQDPAWFGEIYVMKTDGSEVRRLTHQPGYDGGPFFSPDGQRIIWRRFDSTGVNADVFTMKVDGTDVRRLTDFKAMSWAPYFHPSGRYAIFTANKLGFENFELFLVDSQGEREPVRVTFSDGFDGLPVFSPNGSQLCWTSNRTPEKQSQLFLAQWNHEAALEALAKAPPRQSQSGTSPTPGSDTAAHVHPPDAAPHPAPDLSPEIRRSDLRQHVEFLASDRLAGRLTGSEGAQLAADYLSRLLQQASLSGFAGGTSCFQSFEFTASSQVVTGDTRLTWISVGSGLKNYAVEQDFRPLSFTANGAAEGEVVFAGYGLVVPGKPGVGYDSYAGLDVSNKVVVVLRYVPEEVESKRRQELNRYAGLRYKAMMAREHGARALLVVTGPNSPHAEDLIPLSSDGSLSGSGIVAMSVKASIVGPWFSAEGKDLKALQTGLDTENPHAEGGFRLSKTKISLAASVRQLKQTDRNVVALLPPSPGVSEYVMVGAHYDHLGHGDGNSLHRKGEENQIHSGADDNASGVAAVLELAASIAGPMAQASEPRRGLLVAFWSGEEMGLLGSSYFAEHPPLGLSNIAAYVNFDMVGRLRDNRLSLQGIGSSAAWRRLIERRNVAAGFSLNLQEDPYLPTDVTAFYPKGIPVLNFFTGSHEDYHRPTDKPETLNYEGLERITHFATRLVRDLLQPGEAVGYVKVARAAAEGGSRDNLRAYLGTIPDYATEVSGVKLSGVRGGSPADKAGLKGGDVITQFAGQKIANIYDYTYALDAVKIGLPVVVVVQRGSESLTLTVTPEARK